MGRTATQGLFAMRRCLLLSLLLSLSSLALPASLKTSDGLTLSLTDDGQVNGLSASGRSLPVKPDGGFCVVDAAVAEPDNLLPA